MARKKSTAPKAGKKLDTPKLTVFGDPEELVQPRSKSLDPLPPLFFRNMFEDDGFELIMMDERSFVTGPSCGMTLMIKIDEVIPIVTFEFPLKAKQGTTKPKILNWINERMLEFPMLRLVAIGNGTIVSSFDYAYDGELDFDAEHFFMTMSMFWGLMMSLLAESGEAFLDMSFMPVPMPFD